MAGHSRLKDGVASARLTPGHPRLACEQGKKDVDARHKAGHDELVRVGICRQVCAIWITLRQIKQNKLSTNPHESARYIDVSAHIRIVVFPCRTVRRGDARDDVAGRRRRVRAAPGSRRSRCKSSRRSNPSSTVRSPRANSRRHRAGTAARQAGLFESLRDARSRPEDPVDAGFDLPDPFGDQDHHQFLRDDAGRSRQDRACLIPSANTFRPLPI